MKFCTKAKDLENYTRYRNWQQPEVLARLLPFKMNLSKKVTPSRGIGGRGDIAKRHFG
ncbi:MAG: hypothetical protein MPJ24_08565 [Pirellulaceae bacterium]|nr:hypothetical protein [Pirellulaceae bacterium]